MVFRRLLSLPSKSKVPSGLKLSPDTGAVGRKSVEGLRVVVVGAAFFKKPLAVPDKNLVNLVDISPRKLQQAFPSTTASKEQKAPAAYPAYSWLKAR